jgi:hypothetical protein
MPDTKASTGSSLPGRPDGQDQGADAATGLMWGVGAVSLRVGIATPTLRTWERRYGLGPSQRTGGGHRRYSEDDIARVQLMGRLVTRGVSAHAAAKVALSSDASGLGDVLAGSAAGGVARPDVSLASSPSIAIAAILRATQSLDAIEVGRAYSGAITDWGVVGAWTNVFVPALREIGDRWAAGTLGVDAEHLASERLLTELRDVVRNRTPQRVAEPPIVLASAEDEMHSLPVVALEAALAAAEVAAFGLGGRLPLPALTDVVARIRPGVVFLWASMPRHSEQMPWEAFMSVGKPMTVLLGGPGWPADAGQPPPGVTVERSDALAPTVERIIALAQGDEPSRAG